MNPRHPQLLLPYSVTSLLGQQSNLIDKMGDPALKIEKLAGAANWELWQLRMQSLLIGKEYWNVVGGDGMEVDDGPDVEKLRELESKALAYIRLHLRDGPLLQTRQVKKPKDLWDKLKALYEPKGFSSDFLICKDLFDTTLTKCGGSIEKYLNKLVRLTDDLEARKITIPKKVIVAWALNHLTPEYEQTVAVISQSFRSNKKEIDMDTLFTQLLDESRRLKSRDSTKETALAVKSGPNKSTERPKCTHCKKKGHEESKCWKKHPEKKPKKPNSKDKSQQKDDVEDNEEVTLISSAELAFHNDNEEESVNWILDSGATSHICSNRALFSTIEPYTVPLRWGTASQIQTTGKGTIKIKFDSTQQTVKITDCLYVPEIGVNLLSIGALDSKGLKAEFGSGSVQISTQKRVIATGYYHNRLPTFRTSTLHEKAHLVREDPKIWHKRLAHVGPIALKHLPEAVTGCRFTAVTKKSSDICDICVQAKQTAIVSRKPSTPVEGYLDKVHSDICGPLNQRTFRGYRYIATFIDTATRYAEIAPLKTKDEVYDEFRKFVIREETQTGLKLKHLHSDNGPEYKNGTFQEFFDDEGILATYAAPYTHEQHGLAEKFNRTLLDKVRALLFQAQVPKSYWADAAIAACYIYNRTPHSSKEFKTPYELKFNKKPDISNLKIWGSIAYRKDPHAKKLDPKVIMGILIGYGSNQYKILDPRSKRVTWARDVIIKEGSFYKNKEDIDDSTEELAVQYDSESTEIFSESLNQDEASLNESEDSIPQQFIDELIESASALNANIIHDPVTYWEAMNGPDKDEWLKAMIKELKDLEAQKTWTLVELPQGRKALKSRWVYKIKTDAGGNITRYKARFVVKGYLQKFGLDYNETFANTVRPGIYRALFFLAAELDWEIHQWDIKSAFPNADVEEEIYVQQPYGFEQDKKLVLRLNKALYGLKQSARNWQQYLGTEFKRIGLKQLPTDPSIFIGEGIIIITHVDDMIVIGRNTAIIAETKAKLTGKMELHDLGVAKYFLGIEIFRDRPYRAIQLVQKGYIERLLNKFTKGLHPGINPCSLGVRLEPNQEKASAEDINNFQQNIGSLMYLMTATRPDLAFPVGQLARFMANPSGNHFKALQRIWSYVLGTKTHGLTYKSASTSPQLQGYVDADWGGGIGTRRSTTGYLFLVGNTAISWKSKLQKTVALSSCEAEYMALKDAIKEQAWLRSMFESIEILTKSSSKTLYTDSQSARSLTRNPVFHERSKHIDIQYHYARESVLEGRTDLQFIPTDQQLADGLTKAISNEKWARLLESIGLQSLQL